MKVTTEYSAHQCAFSDRSSISLRPYQSEAVDAVERYLSSCDGNPCCVLPTGAGKSHVISELASNAVGRGQRVLVIAHVKELLVQSFEKIVQANGDPRMSVGLYSAGLKLDMLLAP